jgi:hypothetical protein
MAKPKWFRIAREGGTIDGREIQADDLIAMAENYDPEIYGARINKEHFRGIFWEEQFGAYGDVLELKTETDKTGKVCLLGLLDPTDELVAMNKKRQKVYTSVEMAKIPEFDGFYLGGLAVTDSPASTGTSMLSFSAQKNKSFSMVVKDDQGNDKTVTFKTTSGEWSDHFETEIDFSTESSGVGEKLFSKVQALLGKKQAGDDKQYADVSEAVTAIAVSQKELMDTSASYASNDEVESLKTQIGEMEQKYSDLIATLEQQPGTSYQKRPPQDNSGQVLTDC